MTSIDTELRIPNRTQPLKVPAGTPVDLIARVDPREVPAIVQNRLVLNIVSDETLFRGLIRRNQAPDFVLDRGHLFGSRAARRRQARAHRIHEDILMYPHIFSPIAFRTFTAKNRIFRSNVSGRFDNYDGSGTQTRINWELKFARGGVGAIVSSFVPVAMRGRIMPNYATIDRDERIPFWKELIKQVHNESDCKYLIQLSHGGRQRDVPGIEYEKGLSSTDRADPLHGFECERMTIAQIGEVARAFGAGAARARAAGADGVELHGANGYLITQFLSSGINDRKDDYGGSLNNRARFLLDIVREIRKEVGRDFHLQMKISAVEFNDALDDDEEQGEYARGFGAGVQVARRGRRRRDPRVVGLVFPSSEKPGRRSADRRVEEDLRHADLERVVDLPQLPVLPLPDDRGRSSSAAGRKPAATRSSSRG